jgi:hypothetical protein
MRECYTLSFLLATIILADGCVTGRARAGYYTTIDTPTEVSPNQDYERVFTDVLANLKTISLDKADRESAIRQRYLLIDAMGSQGALELKTLEQQLNYSAVLIRRGKPKQALDFLLPFYPKHQTNFVLLAHLASAQFLAAAQAMDDALVKDNPAARSELLSKAQEYQKGALDSWPSRWDQLDEEQRKFMGALRWEPKDFDRNRLYETYLLRLMRHRFREVRLPKSGPSRPETLDPIFVFGPENTPVRFVNEQGAFEVGRIAAKEMEKLPGNAVAIVEQLLIWMPGDDRLFWLLGEVLNASAMNVKEEDKREEMRLKNEMIKNAQRVFTYLKQKNTLINTTTDPIFGTRKKSGPQQELHGWKLIQEHDDALSKYVANMPDPNLVVPPDVTPPAVVTEKSDWTRPVIVSFVTGFAVGLAALWQFQEMRRRRQARREPGA